MPEINDVLIHRHLSGETNTAEAAEIERWRGASTENEANYRELEDVWSQTKPETFESRFDMDAGWRDLSARLGLESSNVVPMSIETPSKPFYKHYAYGLVALAAALIAAFLLLRTETPMYRIATPVGSEPYMVDLGGTARVWLAGGAFVEFPEGMPGDTREVMLRGEGYFEVDKDTRPFVVRMENGTQVKVLGTGFNVWNGHDKTRVSVFDGRVSLSNRDDSVVLGAGEESSGIATGQLSQVRTIDHSAKAWLDGRLIFDHQPLHEVILDLNRHFGMRISLQGAVAAQQTITAVFNRDDELETALEEICLTLGLTLESTDQGYLITE